MEDTMNKRLNKLLVTLLQLAYAYIGSEISIEYKSDNLLKYYVGIVISIILLDIIDCLLITISYKITGNLRANHYISYYEMQSTHWVIRVAFVLILYLITCSDTLTNLLLTPVIGYLSDIVLNWLNGRGVLVEE
jgi:hypothetical protein